MNSSFFVGYLPVPPGLRVFLALVAAVLLGLFAGLALAVAATQDNPGEGGVFGRVELTGMILPDAYPLLYVTEGDDRVPAGSVLFMSALNKAGVARRVAEYEGKLATIGALYTQRGDLAMLQLRGGGAGVSPAEGEAPEPPAREALGRWRLTGEICDGKCYAGAMRPGRGLSHKACAALCVAGGVPPVMVLVEPFEGREFLLVTGPEGEPVDQEALNLMGVYLSVEGDVERVGDLLIFRLSPDTAEIL